MGESSDLCEIDRLPLATHPLPPKRTHCAFDQSRHTELYPSRGAGPLLGPRHQRVRHPLARGQPAAAAVAASCEATHRASCDRTHTNWLGHGGWWRGPGAMRGKMPEPDQPTSPCSAKSMREPCIILDTHAP